MKKAVRNVFCGSANISLYCYLLDTKEGVSLSPSPFTSVLTPEYGKDILYKGAALLRRAQLSSVGAA